MKRLKEELTPLYLFVASMIVFPALIAVGIIYLTGKSFYKAKFRSYFIYWGNVLYQIWVVIKYMLLHLAVIPDLLANVTSGEMIEDIVTTEEDTLYGNGDVTISAATGEIELRNKLIKTGLKFTACLSKVLGGNHCINAYKNYLKNGE